MSDPTTYSATCFCGAVELELSVAPEVMAYCHCDYCRSWSAAQVSAFTLWQPSHVKVIRGEDHLAMFNKFADSTDGRFTSERCWCKSCGGHVLIKHPTVDLIDVPAAIIKGLKFKPAFHANYEHTVARAYDGIPKFKDLPAEAGGSGIVLED